MLGRWAWLTSVTLAVIGPPAYFSWDVTNRCHQHLLASVNQVVKHILLGWGAVINTLVRSKAGRHNMAFNKGYSTIACTPFLRKMTMRFTVPCGLVIVCITSWTQQVHYSWLTVTEVSAVHNIQPHCSPPHISHFWINWPATNINHAVKMDVHKTSFKLLVR